MPCALWSTFQRWLSPISQEKGVTLIELVVAVGLATVIASATALTITTIFRFTRPVEAQAIGAQQVQNAGSWLTRDILMSKVELGDGNPVLVTLTQPQSGTEDVTIVYKKVPVSGGSYQLVREKDTGEGMVIAENVDIAVEQCADGSGTPSFAITIVSQPQAAGAKEVKRYYQVTPRLPQD
jgi:hypothetical protein